MAQKKNEDSGAAEVQEHFDEAAEQGFFGTSPDPTPREHYTLSGVADGKPTPETDAEARAAVRDASGR
jgi:hypothetical protein